MNRRTTQIATLIAVLGLAMVGQAAAQQMQRVSYKATAENTKYTQQQFVDVGDVPDHQVRSFEIYRSFPADPPVINGMKVKEQWTRGTSDYIGNNGTATTYGVYVMENGDKFFTRSTVLAHNAGGGKFTNVTVGQIMGGTGRLAGIRGIVRASGSANPKAGMNETQTDIEYAIDK
jgi:NAD-dependent DNA ligase